MWPRDVLSTPDICFLAVHDSSISDSLFLVKVWTLIKTNVLPLHNSFFGGYVLSMKLWRVELKILNIVPLSEKTISNQGITILLHSNKQVAMDLPARDLLLTVCTSCKYVTTGELSELLFTPARVLLQSTTHKQNFAENSKSSLHSVPQSFLTLS